MHRPIAAFINAAAGVSAELDDLSRSLTVSLRAEWDGASGLHSSTRTITAQKAKLSFSGRGLTLQVFGDLHGFDEATLRQRLEHAESAAEAAAALVKDAWGGYVAFLEDRSGSFVLRDPSGAVPLYVARIERLQLASTHITPTFLRAAGLSWQIDVPAVAKLLANPPAAGYLSGLSEIEIAEPGRLISMKDRSGSRTIWSPSAIARRRETLEPAQLSSTLDTVLGTMARQSSVGVELSGGFDSSVVFSSLARLGNDPKPFNFATSGKGGDETRFARDAADKWGIPLHTFSSASKLPDYRAFDAADHGVQPVLHGLDSVFAHARQRLVDKEKVDRVMTGQGGDALFFRLPSRLVALDRRRELGIASLLARSTLDDARRVNGSIWSVLTTAMGRRTGHDSPELDWTMSHLLGDAATDHLTGPQPKHPWLNDCDDLSPGKYFHLMMLSHCQLFHGPRLFAPSVPMMHPLLTQPLIELTLACPTYILQSGPLDRGLAREAFRERLPTSVLHRRSKGEASDHYARAILHNRDWLLNHLLGGRLAAIGLVDPVVVERALDPGSMRLGTDYRAFVQYASIESWMRYWS